MTTLDIPPRSGRSPVDPILIELTLARQARGMSVRGMAKRIFRSPSTVSTWENGIRTPPIEGVRAYAAVLGKRLVLVDDEGGA